MKKIKKIISVFLAITTVICLFAVTASAALEGYSHQRHVYDSDRFKTTEWEHTRHYISGGEYIGRLVYGYDTDYVDEDYAWAYGADCKSQALIYRVGHDETNDFQEGPIAEKDTYSKLQIENKSNNVYYKIIFELDYTNVTSYLDEDTLENRS